MKKLGTISDKVHKSSAYKTHEVCMLLTDRCTGFIYSGTPPNGHPSKADTHDITDNSESPNCPSIHFNT